MDPLAEKYYPISPYVYVANNPIKHIDPDGRKIVDANGKVIYADGKWLSNATEGAKLIGNNMLRTQIGRQSFTELVNASYDVQLIYDNTSDIGNIGLAEREYNMKTGETTKATITVFERNLVSELNDLKNAKNNGLNLQNPTESQAYMFEMGIPNQAERIGQVGVHEAEHILNPKAWKTNSGDYEAAAVKAEIKAIKETFLNKPIPALKFEIKIPEINVPKISFQ